MVKSKRKKRSMACKVLCASFLTALVIQNSYLFSIPVYAEDDSSSDLEIFYNQFKDTLVSSTASALLGTVSPHAAAIWWSVNTMTKICLEHPIGTGSAGGYEFDGSTNCITGYYRREGETGDFPCTVPCFNGVGDNQTVTWETGSEFLLCEAPHFNINGYLSGTQVSKYTISNYVQIVEGGSRAHVWDHITPVDASASPVTVIFNFTSSSYGGASGAFTSNTAINDYTYTSLAYGLYIPMYNSGIPTYNANSDISNFFSTAVYGREFLGQAFQVSMPSGELVYAEPWTYYNDVLLPYMETNYPDTVPYMPFPDGFEPTPPMDGSIDDLVLPPGIPSASFNAPEIPSEPLPQKMLEGAGFWFTQFDNLLEGLGIKWIIIIFMCVALLMAILRM